MIKPDKAVSVFTNFPAGGEPAGLYGGCVASFIEKESGFPFSQLSEGIHASSVGTSIGVPLYAKNPDDPEKPLFSASQTHEMCETYSQVWLSRQINFFWQHIKSLHPSYKNSRADHLFFDDHVVEATLNEFLGNVTFADLLGSVFISGHNLSAEPGKVATMFWRIADRNGGATYSHSAHLKVVDAMQGSMAVPGAFRARNIEGVGDISDFAMIYSADRAFRNFRRQLPPGAGVHYLELGSPRLYGTQASVFNRHSMLGLILNHHFMRAVSNQSYSNAIQGIREDIGDANVSDLTPAIPIGKFTGRGRVTEDFLDASKQTISLLKEFACDHIDTNRDKFMRVAEFLGENKISKDKPRAELPPILTANLNQEKSLSGKIWTKARSFWPVPYQPVPQALH